MINYKETSNILAYIFIGSISCLIIFVMQGSFIVSGIELNEIKIKDNQTYNVNTKKISRISFTNEEKTYMSICRFSENNIQNGNICTNKFSGENFKGKDVIFLNFYKFNSPPIEGIILSGTFTQSNTSKKYIYQLDKLTIDKTVNYIKLKLLIVRLTFIVFLVITFFNIYRLSKIL